MIILIAGAGHTGKTLLAQKLMERYRYPALSMDLLKMGLIRSGTTDLTPEDDELLTPYLWGIVREMVKTAIENKQNLIVEGCYIPFDWKADFEPKYLTHIEFCCLAMTRSYLENHADDVRNFADAIECRLSDDMDTNDLMDENERNMAACRARGLNCHVIDAAYDVGTCEVSPLSGEDFAKAADLFFETVHAINLSDYTQEQVDAWAPLGEKHRDRIIRKLSSQQTVGIKECGILIGFGSLDGNGDIDMLFVHKDRQGQGIGTMILKELEHLADERGRKSVSLFSSITARPFFERSGYTVANENIAIRNGVPLTNYLMRKHLP